MIERFAGKFIPGSTSECWNWTGARNGKGYGQMKQGRRNVDAHRLMYQFEFGLIPDGMHVLHLCDNPACVNPAHLFLGTHRDNMADMSRKGRSLKGRKYPAYSRKGMPSVPDYNKMRELRACGMSYRAIAKATGFGTMTVWDNLQGGTYLRKIFSDRGPEGD